MVNEWLQTTSHPPSTVVNTTLHLPNVPPGVYEQINHRLSFALTSLTIFIVFHWQITSHTICSLTLEMHWEILISFINHLNVTESKCHLSAFVKIPLLVVSQVWKQIKPSQVFDLQRLWAALIKRSTSNRYAKCRQSTDTVVVNFPYYSCVASNCSNWILICVPLISHLAPQPPCNLFHNRERNRHVHTHVKYTHLMQSKQTHTHEQRLDTRERQKDRKRKTSSDSGVCSCSWFLGGM